MEVEGGRDAHRGEVVGGGEEMPSVQLCVCSPAQKKRQRGTHTHVARALATRHAKLSLAATARCRSHMWCITTPEQQRPTYVKKKNTQMTCRGDERGERRIAIGRVGAERGGGEEDTQEKHPNTNKKTTAPISLGCSEMVLASSLCGVCVCVRGTDVERGAREKRGEARARHLG